MTLPSSPPLSLSQIKGEFGGPGNLRSYLAGGSYVPSGTSGVGGPVPSSLPLDILIFLGTSNYIERVTVGIGVSGGFYGYINGATGSASPTTFFAGGNFVGIGWQSGGSPPFFSFKIDLDSVPQGSFTNLNVDGTNYTSASATYTTDGATFTQWLWNSGDPWGAGICTFT